MVQILAFFAGMLVNTKIKTAKFQRTIEGEDDFVISRPRNKPQWISVFC